MIDVKDKFWERYIKANEIDRHNLVEQLTGIDIINSTLMQSYFDDLINYLKEQKEIKEE